MKNFWIDINSTVFLNWANNAFNWQNETPEIRKIMVEEFCEMVYQASGKNNKINFIDNKNITLSIENLIISAKR